MLNFELAVTFLLIFARIGSFMVAVPVFGGPNSPGPVKAGMAFVVSMIMLPLVAAPQHEITGGLPGFSLALAREIGVGLLTGFVCNMILQVFNIVGQIFDLHVGFLMSNYFDPVIGGQITLTAKFLYMLGIVMFFTLDGHHMLLLGLAKSFEIVPLDTAVFGGGGMTVLVKTFARIVTVAIQISAPVIAVIVIIDICLGLMGRTAPQMNIFMLGFPVKIGAGILTMAVTVPLLGVVFQSLFRMMERDLYVLLKGLVQGG
ncbi:MAG: flagellar type III secretion system protein FliR [Peptococcaceae bacterium]|nr:flagellar type III secretion system protein FliR [Peptococcaceae bacterium]